MSNEEKMKKVIGFEMKYGSMALIKANLTILNKILLDKVLCLRMI